MKLNFACKSCRRRGVSRERHTRSVAIGRRGVIIMWGVTAGKASHNASNARGVTAGKMGRNSSISKKTENLIFLYTYMFQAREAITFLDPVYLMTYFFKFPFLMKGSRQVRVNS